MKPQIFNARTLISTAVASILLVACTARQIQPEAVNNARSKLTMLQSNQPLASQAPVAIKEAEVAVRAAEVSQGDKEQVAHLMYIAERKVDTAQALAESRLLVEQRTALSQQRETARLDSRTKEVDIARSNADSARIETLAAQKEVENARSNAESSRLKTLAAQQESANAQQKAADLQRQIAELNAKPTERGLVVTLGDVLFDTGKAELKSGATTNLAKLATFLNQHQNRSVMIEGHTDTVGNADYNQALSQRRADSVKGWLMKQGIHSDRLVTAGKGETSPVSGNDSASGRQLNRRVEVIIENTDANVDEKISVRNKL
ncbi:OmpA family protein [Methylophilus sp. 13]|uniref:OmpA family protein n=1 Tax=Methylophilus sp. 13 TaxID=2781018 RepID=UPI00188FDA87|nr:OmpA family protein [Methylophilus sp. 13]MBF5040047.1 OmpA family protein [Methylophilus sp. 13]